MKKAISPVIGTVILISLSVVLGVTVFIWTKNYASNIGEETSEQALCRNVNFAVGDVCYQDSGEGRKIKFNVQNYASNLSLSGFMITLEYEGSIKSVSSELIEINALSSGDVVSEFIENIEEIKQIKIIPKIKSDTKIINCEDKEIVVVWREVKTC